MEENVRQRILKAAARMFLQYGFKRTTMEEIASLVGVAKGTLYLHFTSKEAIFRAMVDEQIEDALERMRAVRESGLPSEEKLIEMMRAVLLHVWDFVHQAPHAPDLWAETLRDTGHPSQHAESAARPIIADVIAEGQAAGVFAPELDPVEMARLVQSAMHGFMPPYSYINSREEIERDLPRLMTLLMEGMKSPTVSSAVNGKDASCL